MSSSKDTLNNDSGKAEEGSTQRLLSLKRPPCDCDKKRRKRTAKILCGLLILLNIGLCGLIIALYSKTVKLEQYWNELEMSEVVQQHRLGQERQLPLNTGNPEKFGTDQEGGKPVPEVDQERTDEDEIKKGISILLTGSLSHLSLRSTGSDVQSARKVPIDIWAMTSERSADDHSIFTLTNHTAINIWEDGLYMIYGQVSWRRKSGAATYHIQRFAKDSSSAETLAQCITYFSTLYAILESCYTSVTVQLHKGDRLDLSAVSNNLTIDFKEGRSFFGVTQIQSHRQQYS